MKPEELRIGNIVTINNKEYHPGMKDIPVVVRGISEMHDEYSISLVELERKPNQYYEDFHQFIKYIEAIPITEEWLKRFGFIYTPELFAWVNENHGIYKSKTDGCYLFNIFHIHDFTKVWQFNFFHALFYYLKDNTKNR